MKNEKLKNQERGILGYMGKDKPDRKLTGPKRTEDKEINGLKKEVKRRRAYWERVGVRDVSGKTRQTKRQKERGFLVSNEEIKN